MIKVITIESERKSAEKLGWPTYSSPHFYVDDCENDVIIRWGYGAELYNRQMKLQEFTNVINPSKAIALNCDKNKALQKLASVVNTPKIYLKKVPKGKLVVYRSTSHTGGNGFNVQRGPIKIEMGRYATEFINTKTEFRVWFANGKTMMARRYTTNKEKLKAKYQCRSSYLYRFYKKVPKSLHDQVLKAANVIGLISGAADILYYRGKYYFTELNSSPSIDDSKGMLVKFYKNNLLNFIKKKFKNVDYQSTNILDLGKFKIV